MIVQNGKYISILYSLKLERDNTPIVTRLKKPLELLVGTETLILGLDKELLGLKAGEKTKIKITPENGYGLRDEQLVLSLKRSQIGKQVKLQEGMTLKRKTKDGILRGVVKSINDQDVVVDLNHPLAGKTLKFEAEIVGIRNASPKESTNR